MTDRTPVNTANEYQLEVTSASNINVSLYLIALHKKNRRDNPARPTNQFNNAISDNIDPKTFFVEIDSVWYPKDPTEANYTENIHLDHYRVLKLFHKGYNVESLENSFVS